MIQIVTSNIPLALIAVGLLVIALEVAVLGFATFILFFIGLSLVLTGGAMWLELLPTSLDSIFLSNAIVSSILALVLWKPMKKLQNQADDKQVKSDFDGLRFFCVQAIDKRGLTQHQHSGISWALKSDQPIEANTEVEVVKAEVGAFWVKAVS